MAALGGRGPRHRHHCSGERLLRNDPLAGPGRTHRRPTRCPAARSGQPAANRRLTTARQHKAPPASPTRHASSIRVAHRFALAGLGVPVLTMGSGMLLILDVVAGMYPAIVLTGGVAAW